MLPHGPVLSRALLAAVVASTSLLPPGSAAVPARQGGGANRGAQMGGAPWWTTIDTGPFISDTFSSARTGDIVALKGVAIKLGPDADASAVFDTELLAWRAGFDGAIQLKGTAWNGAHADHSHYPEGAATFYFENPAGPGWAIDGDWADPRRDETGPWSDPRVKASGPLPRGAGKYLGLYRHGRDIVVHYTIGGTEVRERPALESVRGRRVLTRTLNVGSTAHDLELLAQDSRAATARLDANARVHLIGAPAGVTLHEAPDGRTTLSIPRGSGPTHFKIAYARDPLDPGALAAAADLRPLTRGGPGLFPRAFTVQGQQDSASADQTYAVDVIPLPTENPWHSPPRFGGFDIFPDGKRLAASTWNGDVWIAEGIDGDLSAVTWRRFAAGLYQTLGLKIVDGRIYTHGRDQITRLHDLNGDGEADHFECFNNDVKITSGFHEFSFDLQTDAEGNFYFSKAMPVNPGGRGFGPWTPHNGTVLKVSRDGSKLERVAWGLRAPGGVGVSPDGVVTTGENEGSFVPACKITWTQPGTVTFNGVVPSRWNGREYGGPLPGAPGDYDRPLCWLPYNIDNSSGSQVWVPERTGWDPRHAGEMLHLSYGKSSIFRVLREEVNGQVQGGVYRLPIEVSAAVMRARFHPTNGDLYVIGFRGWQTNGRDALQRIRYTGAKRPLPVGLHAHANGLLVRFSEALDPNTAEDPQRYSISKWNYVWGPQYGSGRFSIDRRDPAAEAKALVTPSKGAHMLVDPVGVAAAKLLEDGRAVFLYIPEMTPAMQMELKMDLAAAGGAPLRETIYHTVHTVAPAFTVPGVRWDELRVAAAPPAGEPGLLLSFGAEITDTLRLDQLAWAAPAGTPPSVFMAPREFSASFQGMLIVPERDTFTFSLEGVGTATLHIDGQTVLSGDLPAVAGAPVTLAKGAHAIFCSYRSGEGGEARIRLMWSSPQFRIEPVPASAFRFLPGAEFEAWTRARHGREVFAGAHCIQCHQPRGGMPRDAAPELLASVPDFANIGDRIRHEWLARWIAAPQGHCPSVATGAAGDVAAYLAAKREGSAAVGGIPADPASIAAGADLVNKLHLAPWIEPLAAERKHTDGGLVELLRAPARHHPDTRFPDVRLGPIEARQIAAYVRSRQPASSAPAPAGDPAAGERIAATSCLVCHAPESATPPAAPSLEEIARSDWAVRGCVSANRGRAPDLRLAPAAAAALIAFRNADRDVGMQSLRRFSPAEYAMRQMDALRCAECHSGRDKVPDIVLAGEKFDREWLVELFAGRAEKTRPWLEARMPAFASRAAHLATGLAHKHGVAPEPDLGRPAAELVAAGEHLAGANGYSCVACHDAGSQKALAVFEGQGPNLRAAPRRLRHDYFQRWMHDPQRIAPATIMPRYTQGPGKASLDTYYSGNAERQFDALWHWMRSLPPEGP